VRYLKFSCRTVTCTREPEWDVPFYLTKVQGNSNRKERPHCHLALMRPLWGKETDELFKGFLKPLFRVYTTDGMDKGVNTINYDASLAMYFYGSPYSDPADPIIAAT
jgi:hypothetical protein